MCVLFRVGSCLRTSKNLSLGCDKCLKHSSYTRVGSSFSHFFHSTSIVFMDKYLILSLCDCRYNGAKRTTFGSHFWINEEQQGGDFHVATSPYVATSPSHRCRVNKLQKSIIQHVATSPRRDVATSPRRHVATSARKSASPSLNARRLGFLGHWRTCGGRHENREQNNTAFKELLGF